MPTWLISEALTLATTLIQPASVDPLLSGAEQALCSECLQQISLAQGRLQPDNTIPPGQRQGTASGLFDKAKAATAVHNLHYQESDAARDAYGGFDLMVSCGEAILL